MSQLPFAAQTSYAAGTAPSIKAQDLLDLQKWLCRLNVNALYGDGSDGYLTFDGTSTVAGLAPSGGVYTLARPLLAFAMTVKAGAQVKANGFPIYVATLLTMLGGSITANGSAGSGTTAGAGAAAGVLLGGGPGGAGGAGVGGFAGTGTTASQGGSGGAGGTVGGNAGGSGGTATQLAASLVPRLRAWPGCIHGVAWPSLTFVSGGAGGGGGGAGVGNGGGGGGGGGVLLVAARAIYVQSGSTNAFQAMGGAGVAGAGGTGGNGGGGGGGLVLLTSMINCSPLPLSSYANVSGGTAGSGGSGGAAGSSGQVLLAQF